MVLFVKKYNINIYIYLKKYEYFYLKSLLFNLKKIFYKP